jgi:hypothetical protein
MKSYEGYLPERYYAISHSHNTILAVNLPISERRYPQSAENFASEIVCMRNHQKIKLLDNWHG